MRYITYSKIKEGMVLARPFYGNKFEVLLGEGITLSASLIQRISNLGYPGAYIEDELSAGIKAEGVIPGELRINIIKEAKQILQQVERSELQQSGKKATKERQSKLIMQVIEALIANPRRIVDMIDLKPYDDYVYYHAANVVILSLLVGVEMGIAGTQLFELGMASLLYDVGSIFVPKSILNKPGKLTPEEFGIIKSHSQMGFEYLRENFDISIEACMGALQHHENYNGTGYPNKLKKDKISIYGRIIAITDVYDALTSRRPFREIVFPPSAMDFMDASCGTMFDPDILDALKRVVSMYPAGFCVELDSGARGIVVENYPGDTARPKLKIIGNISSPPVYVDLHADEAYSDTGISEIIEY